jgi:hypothetical protein
MGPNSVARIASRIVVPNSNLPLATLFWTFTLARRYSEVILEALWRHVFNVPNA